jgi:hypothetical protein
MIAEHGISASKNTLPMGNKYSISPTISVVIPGYHVFGDGFGNYPTDRTGIM